MRVREYQLVALQRSLNYAQELVRYGFANYPEVLMARHNYALRPTGERP